MAVEPFKLRPFCSETLSLLQGGSSVCSQDNGTVLISTVSKPCSGWKELVVALELASNLDVEKWTERNARQRGTVNCHVRASSATACVVRNFGYRQCRHVVAS